MATFPDGRTIPPTHADERTTLEAWLDFHRDTLAVKCAGLTDDQLRSAPLPSTSLTLLGLLQHMAEVERNWCRRIARREDLPPVHGAGNADGFALDPARGGAEALAVWREEIARGRAALAGMPLDGEGRLSPQEAAGMGGAEVTLRWIYVHLVEEYARHNGHADLLREAVDGATGP